MNYQEYPYPEESSLSSFMYKVYGWMSFALSITAAVAYYIFKTEHFFNYLRTHSGALIGLIILQFALVLVLSFFIMKISFSTAVAAFILYASSVGVTMASIFFVYTKASIYATFGVTAGTFAIMALYGYVTKTDLSSLRSFFMMGLIGLFVSSLINMFLQSSSFEFVISAFGVLLFTGLTAYDSQKIKKIGSRLMDRETRGKIAIIGALTLYLDFINLFLFLLRFMGNQRER